MHYIISPAPPFLSEMSAHSIRLVHEEAAFRPTQRPHLAAQASKIYMGKCQAITAIYDGYVLVQINDAPLVISLVADVDANLGVIMAIAPKLQEALAPLRSAVMQI